MGCYLTKISYHLQQLIGETQKGYFKISTRATLAVPSSSKETDSLLRRSTTVCLLVNAIAIQSLPAIATLSSQLGGRSPDQLLFKDGQTGGLVGLLKLCQIVGFRPSELTPQTGWKFNRLQVLYLHPISREWKWMHSNCQLLEHFFWFVFLG